MGKVKYFSLKNPLLFGVIFSVAIYLFKLFFHFNVSIFIITRLPYFLCSFLLDLI
jgi:hypothetical protein